MEMMLARYVSDLPLDSVRGSRLTHTNPNAKTPVRATFLVHGSCKLHKTGMGSKMVMTSRTRSVDAQPLYSSSLSPQWPGISEYQFFWAGVQKNAVAKKPAIQNDAHRIMTPIATRIKTGLRKTLMYRSRIDNLMRVTRVTQRRSSAYASWDFDNLTISNYRANFLLLTTRTCLNLIKACSPPISATSVTCRPSPARRTTKTSTTYRPVIRNYWHYKCKDFPKSILCTYHTIDINISQSLAWSPSR